MQNGLLAVEKNGDEKGVELPAEGIKLNLGCGRHVLSGWVNIDAGQSPNSMQPPDLMCDVKAIPLPDGCATEIMAIHLFEHLYRWECDPTIEEWKRLLRPGGKLVLEMPDLRKCCRNILEDKNDGHHLDQLGMWGLFGDPREKNPLMTHCWGWTFATIKPFLGEHGFIKVIERETQWHKVGKLRRDFRVEALKA